MKDQFTAREEIIKNYLAGYNSLNIEHMVQDLDEQIVFENIQNGEVTLTLTGLPAFTQQAEQAIAYFSERTQTIKSMNHVGNTTEVEIDYRAILAVDLPNGMKSGEELKLMGKSIFQFTGDRIVQITDIS
ncbi:nuclear transport factor 2 family protein [Adhaeribacter swui]|uniref:Nuclear transport factor 2 family protein n=1 Tax=Adhaeribacter swui TaxID=2086471 RepID=A0A7G7GEA8_9BACT|nr:nuclear transport factor 2 family protein [Adhaeribacter swui]QNF35492.1 nuclear transport factor 2 family protein [Adhaeribacter swui]